jgi:hypothetical protein
MKKLTLFLMAMLCLGLASCSKDAEINAFITELDAVTKDITTKIDANPSAAGVDEAQKSFDSKKASLTEKWNGIKDAVGMQVSADTKKKLEDSVTNNMKSLMEVSTKHMMKLATDKDASTKFQKLITDYQTTFTAK